MISKSSMATTTTVPVQCLACFEPRKQVAHSVLIGTDGKTYQKGCLLKGDVPNWPPDEEGGGSVNDRPKSASRMSLQGGAGAPLRKYRIPVGADGQPTWDRVPTRVGSSAGLSSPTTAGLSGSFSSPTLAGSAGSALLPDRGTVERGRGGLPPGHLQGRPQSATSPQATGGGGLHPLLGSLRLLGIGTEDDRPGL